MVKFTLFFSSISMAIAIALGAFGAHGLKGTLSASRLETFHTAVNYQIIHSLALLAIALLMLQLDVRFLKLPAYLMMCGIFIFSGSLYLLVITDKSWLGAVTPLGGLAFIAAWLSLAYFAMTKLN